MTEKLVRVIEWDKAVAEYIDEAHIILLLVSSAFLNSDYINNYELSEAMKRHEAGKARVIPVILRFCDWKAHHSANCRRFPKVAKL